MDSHAGTVNTGCVIKLNERVSVSIYHRLSYLH